MSLASINKNSILKLNYGAKGIDILSHHKILQITSDVRGNYPTMSEAVEFITKDDFVTNFMECKRAFVISVSCRGSLMALDPQKILLLNKYRHRSMIINFESVDGGSFICHNYNGSFKYISNVSMITMERLNNTKFTFEVLLSALKSNIYGAFNGKLLDAKIHVNAMKLAVADDDHLSIRFLMLFENFFAQITYQSTEVIQIAAKRCHFDSLSAIFELNFNEKVFNLRNRAILDVTDERGYNLLMLAVENQNIEATIFLLNSNHFDVNYKNKEGVSAASIICTYNIQNYKAENSQILLFLLQSDSLYPNDYFLMQKSPDLIILNSKMDELHGAIRLGDREKTNEMICNMNLQYFFNQFNESAAYVALECFDIKTYELLLKKGAKIYKDERIDDIYLTENLKDKIKNLHLKYQSPLNNQCIHKIEGKVTCLNIDEIHRSKYQFEFRSALYTLYAKDDFNLILEIIAKNNVDLIFDFDRDSVNYLDPTEGSTTRGYYEDGRISIGARNLFDPERRNKFHATLIHEMTHFVMEKLYKNNGQPFRSGDDEKFRDIYEVCKRNASKEKYIQIVYGDDYNNNDYAELIVRPNHLTALYQNDKTKLRECERNFPELFDFYRKQIVNDMKIMLATNEPLGQQPENAIVGKFKDVESNKIKKYAKHRSINICKYLIAVSIIITISLAGLLCILHLRSNSSEMIQPKSSNDLRPWQNLIASKNSSQIEKINMDAEFPFDEFWGINSTNNPFISAIECDRNDVNFIEDLLNIAENIAFKNCEGKLKKILIDTLEHFHPTEHDDGTTLNYLKQKLIKLLDSKEERNSLNGFLDMINYNC